MKPDQWFSILHWIKAFEKNYEQMNCHDKSILRCSNAGHRPLTSHSPLSFMLSKIFFKNELCNLRKRQDKQQCFTAAVKLKFSCDRFSVYPIPFDLSYCSVPRPPWRQMKAKYQDRICMYSIDRGNGVDGMSTPLGQSGHLSVTETETGGHNKQSSTMLYQQ